MKKAEKQLEAKFLCSNVFDANVNLEKLPKKEHVNCRCVTVKEVGENEA